MTTFAFEKRRDGLEITIVGCTELVPIFDAPTKCIRGVIYLYRQPIPVIDLGIKFGLGATRISGSACIILVKHKRKGRRYKVGIIVDDISDVFTLAGQNMEHVKIGGAGDDGEPGFEAGDCRNLTKVLMKIDQIMCDIDFDSLDKMV
jgi:chemotaxis signal transduction protein